MLLTVLIVIAVLLALILFTIAAANPEAFWSGVGIILLIGIVAGIAVGGYFGVRWLLELDLDEVRVTTDRFAWVFLILAAVGVVFFVREHWQLIAETFVSVAIMILFPAIAFIFVWGLTALMGIDLIYPQLSVMLGIVAAVPAVVVAILLGSRIAARLRGGATSGGDAQAGDAK